MLARSRRIADQSHDRLNPCSALYHAKNTQKLNLRSSSSSYLYIEVIGALRLIAVVVDLAGYACLQVTSAGETRRKSSPNIACSCTALNALWRGLQYLVRTFLCYVPCYICPRGCFRSYRSVWEMPATTRGTISAATTVRSLALAAQACRAT